VHQFAAYDDGVNFFLELPPQTVFRRFAREEKPSRQVP
jgi:hypothetical protein